MVPVVDRDPGRDTGMNGSASLLRRWGWTLALAGLLVAPACTGSRADRPASSMARDLVVRRGVFVDRFLATGELEAVRATELIVPRMPSWETSIRWLEADGASVEAGQRVVDFDDAAFGRDLEEKRLARDQASSDLEQKEAEIAATLADKEFQVTQRAIALEKARNEAAVPAELLPARTWQERQLALSRAEIEHAKALEELEATRTSTEQELAQRRITVLKTEREIEAGERAISETTIIAPRSGILVHGEHPWERRKFQIGDTVWVGLTVATLPDLSAMRVRVKLSDVDDGRIAPGMTATCTLDAWPDAPFSARVLEITPVAQEPERFSLRRAFDVTLELDTSDPDKMRPGMSVKVAIEAARREDVLLAPRAALDLAADPPRAYPEQGGPVDVRLGMCNAMECIVEGGVSEGTRLRARS